MDHKEAKARSRANLVGGVLMGVPGLCLLASVTAKGLYFGAQNNCMANQNVCAGVQTAIAGFYHAAPPFKWLWLNLLPESSGFFDALFSFPGFVGLAMVAIAARLFGDAVFLRGEIKLAERNARRQRMEESLGGGSRRQSVSNVKANGPVTILQAMDRQLAERVDDKSHHPARTTIMGAVVAVFVVVLGQAANVLLGLDR